MYRQKPDKHDVSYKRSMSKDFAWRYVHKILQYAWVFFDIYALICQPAADSWQF